VPRVVVFVFRLSTQFLVLMVILLFLLFYVIVIVLPPLRTNKKF